MRELTLKGFMTGYLKSLSKENSINIFKMTKECVNDNYRMWDTLVLYSMVTEKTDILKRAAKKYGGELPYFIDLKMEDVEKVVRQNVENVRYAKIFDYYYYLKNKKENERELVSLLRQKVIELKEKKGISNYRIYKDLNLNPGNINSWLKNNDSSKLALNLAQKVLEYVENE